jgi:hypothetical protein
MPSPLAATLHSNDKKKKNRAVPGDTITFAFSRLPPEVDDVEVDIQQGQFKESSGDVTPGALLATFKGRVRNGKYVPGTAEAFRRRSVEDMLIKVTDGSKTVEIGVLDPISAVIRNELQILVRGKVNGKLEFFQGKAAMFVYYPLAMIVPTLAGSRDPALDVLANWATQWRDADPTVRHIHRVPPLRPPANPNPRHYDTLIAALREAAKSAPGGIVALAIGHGDGGVGAGLSVAWCDLMPEDVEPIENPDGSTSYPHTLLGNKTSLLFGHIRGNTPGPEDRLVLNAIDRIGDALAGARIPIRKLLLHTCNVGNDKTVPGDRPGDPEVPGFTQLFANRARVPVQAHTDFIEYEGNQVGSIQARYESVSARSRTEWPLSLVSDESVPGPAPKRFPP